MMISTPLRMLINHLARGESAMLGPLLEAVPRHPCFCSMLFPPALKKRNCQLCTKETNGYMTSLRPWDTVKIQYVDQYVDDLLWCSSSSHNCLVHTEMVLNALGNRGYRVSLSKTQIASTTVNYMGLLLTLTSKIIPTQRFRALKQTLRPQTKRELLSVLGLLNFFQI